MPFRSGLGDSAWLLYGLIRSLKPSVCVELGSARGKSTCFIGMALEENRKGKLYAIDPHEPTAWNDSDSVETYELLLQNLKRLRLQNRVQIVRERSEVAGPDWNVPIDVLFIDADHSYDAVKRDFAIYAPHVQSFGVTIFHDTLWSLESNTRPGRPDMGVPRFVEELRQEGYPVVTIAKDFGLSIVQPVKGGISLDGTPRDGTS